MRRAPRRSALALLFMAFVFVAAGACGKKGPPRAPELALPQVIEDLKAVAGKSGAVLTWGRPTRYVDGQRLRDLQGFVIFRKEISATCPDCPVPFRERTTILIDDQERFIQKTKFRAVDQGLSPGNTYVYRVFSRLVDGTLSDPSNEAAITWRP